MRQRRRAGKNDVLLVIRTFLGRKRVKEKAQEKVEQDSM